MKRDVIAADICLVLAAIGFACIIATAWKVFR